MSKKFNLCQDCSGLALKSIGIVIAIVQALTMHTKWKWLTIALTCIAISSPDCVAIYKITAMLLANIKYKQSACFDYFERCSCCAATLAGAFITSLSITGYTLCSASVINCPDAATWVSIVIATIVIPAIYMLAHCKYHRKYTFHKAKQLVQDDIKSLAKDRNHAQPIASDDYKKQLVTKYSALKEINSEIHAINDYVDNIRHSCKLQKRVSQCAQKSDTALQSTQDVLIQLANAPLQDNLITEIQQNQCKIRHSLCDLRASFWEIVECKIKLSETPNFSQSEPQTVPTEKQAIMC